VPPPWQFRLSPVWLPFREAPLQRGVGAFPPGGGARPPRRGDPLRRRSLPRPHLRRRRRVGGVADQIHDGDHRSIPADQRLRLQAPRPALIRHLLPENEMARIKCLVAFLALLICAGGIVGAWFFW